MYSQYKSRENVIDFFECEMLDYHK